MPFVPAKPTELVAKLPWPWRAPHRHPESGLDETSVGGFNGGHRSPSRRKISMVGLTFRRIEKAPERAIRNGLVSFGSLLATRAPTRSGCAPGSQGQGACPRKR